MHGDHTAIDIECPLKCRALRKQNTTAFRCALCNQPGGLYPGEKPTSGLLRCGRCSIRPYFAKEAQTCASHHRACKSIASSDDLKGCPIWAEMGWKANPAPPVAPEIVARTS